MDLTKILVIDDTQSILDVLKDFLEFENYEVHVETNGQRGIDCALKIIPDLIICDVMMPVKNGFEVYLELQNNQITQNIPFIFLTADVNIESKKQENGIKSVIHILKPFNFSTVLEVVKNNVLK